MEVKDTVISIKSQNYENDKVVLYLKFIFLESEGFFVELTVLQTKLNDDGFLSELLNRTFKLIDFRKITLLFKSEDIFYLGKINFLSDDLDNVFLGGKDEFGNYFLKIDSHLTVKYWFLIKQPIINFLQSPNNSTFDDLACYDNDFFNLKLTKHVEEVRTKKRFDFQQLEFSFLPIIIGIAEELPYNDFYDELVFSEQIKFFHTIFYERLFQEHQIKIEDLDTYSLDWIKSKINEFYKYSTRNSTD